MTGPTPAGGASYEQQQIEQLLRRHRLSQFSMTIHNVELAFWADTPADVSFTIVVEKTRVELTLDGRPAVDYPLQDAAVATWIAPGLVEALIPGG